MVTALPVPAPRMGDEVTCPRACGEPVAIEAEPPCLNPHLLTKSIPFLSLNLNNSLLGALRIVAVLFMKHMADDS